jgi:hypothetical protein
MNLLRVRGWNDVLFGIFLIVAGLVGLMLNWELRAGTAMRMGPGYVPILLSWLVLGFGGLMLGRGFIVEGPPPEPLRIRPMLAILAAVGSFLFVRELGLLPGVAIVTLIACAGDRETRWLQSAALAIGLSAFAGLVFVQLLGLPFPLWPAIIGL